MPLTFAPGEAYQFDWSHEIVVMDGVTTTVKVACGRGIYDNMKTAVDTIFVGKERQYNRRFLQMCSHHLVEPVARTPASGWEKGQVENQVGLVRERFFTPRLRLGGIAFKLRGCRTPIFSSWPLVFRRRGW